MVKKDILVVDDDANVRGTLKGILEDEGYHVVTAEDGLKGVEAAEAEPFSLVLMDIVMPGLSGVEAMKKIKKFRPTTIIIMTGHMDAEDLLQEAVRQGARAIVYKPLQMSELLRLVRDVLAETKPSMLVVDDDDSACKILSGILEDFGYLAERVLDYQEAIEMVRQSDYNLIFIDAKMPGVNGFQTVKEIKKIKPYIHVVMFTAYKIDRFIEKVRDCGARAIIRKPFDAEEILKLAEEVLAEKK